MSLFLLLWRLPGGGQSQHVTAPSSGENPEVTPYLCAVITLAAGTVCYDSGQRIHVIVPAHTL